MRPITLLHTADLHLGAGFENYPQSVRERLRENQRVCLAHLVDVAIRQRVDLFVISGDLFDSPSPPPTDRDHVAGCLKRLVRHGVLPVLVTGEADPPASDPWWRALLPREARLLAAQPYDSFELEQLGLTVIGLSHTPRPAGARPLKGFALATGQPRSLLLFHGSVGNQRDREPGVPAATIRELDRVGVDYIALGHQHSWSEVVPSRAVYPGTPCLLPASEAGLTSHRVACVVLSPSGTCEVRAADVPGVTVRTIDVDVGRQTLWETTRALLNLAGETTLLHVHCQGVTTAQGVHQLRRLSDRLATRFFLTQWDWSRVQVIDLPLPGDSVVMIQKLQTWAAQRSDSAQVPSEKRFFDRLQGGLRTILRGTGDGRDDGGTRGQGLSS